MADSLIIGHFVLKISLDLTKSSEVRKAGDQPNCNAKVICRRIAKAGLSRQDENLEKTIQLFLTRPDSNMQHCNSTLSSHLCLTLLTEDLTSSP